MSSEVKWFPLHLMAQRIWCILEIMCTVRRSHIGGWCECIDWSNIELYSSAIVERSCKYIQGFSGEHTHTRRVECISVRLLKYILHAAGVPLRYAVPSDISMYTSYNCQLWIVVCVQFSFVDSWLKWFRLYYMSSCFRSGSLDECDIAFSYNPHRHTCARTSVNSETFEI